MSSCSHAQLIWRPSSGYGGKQAHPEPQLSGVTAPSGASPAGVARRPSWGPRPSATPRQLPVDAGGGARQSAPLPLAAARLPAGGSKPSWPIGALKCK